MTRPRFTLAVVASADGYIARHAQDSPASWASPEEQALFFRAVEAADWCIMGRHTHEAADRPDRRRIVFSSSAPAAGAWRRPTQLWVDPAALGPDALAPLVAHVRRLDAGLILGGTRVHDWFHAAGAIDLVSLTVEPVYFGGGLPILTGQTLRDPLAVLTRAGYAPVREDVLNSAGTRLFTLRRAAP